MEAMLQDIRYAVRSLLKSPGFTATVVITLALGIGANTAIFSALYSVVFRPLPYPHPERLVGLESSYRGSRYQRNVQFTQFQYFRDHATGFDALAVSTGVGVNLFTRSEASHLQMVRVSADYFRVMGVEPSLGRAFSSDEDQPSGPNVVVLSHELWQSTLGGDARILGQAVLVDGVPFTIVGVMPAGFRDPWGDRIDLLSTVAHVGRTIGSGQNLTLLGRLVPGVGLEQANARLKPVFSGFATAFHTDTASRLSLVPVGSLVGQDVRSPLALLFGAIALVLLIACANVAGLLLGRSAARRRELSVRRALGATRARLIRHLLVESLVLGVVSGALG
ncbi:MAG TPA: ABC transporter permease, partial [Gemmatimonadales bacterium]|nr:ABC transporter permease [Gemmatimonadales bacterium]